MKIVFYGSPFIYNKHGIIKVLEKYVFQLLLIFIIFLLANPAFSQIPSSSSNYISTDQKLSAQHTTQPAQQLRAAAVQTLQSNNNGIWFEKNDGQFGNSDVLFGFRTSFGSMGVYSNKLRVVTKQFVKGKNIGQQIVDISFPGSGNKWKIVTGSKATVKGTYNTNSGSIQAAIFNELTLTNVYPGIDLRLYSGEGGALEFDWLVSRASDYEMIRMNFKGQDGIHIKKNGTVIIDLKHSDLKLVIPETYQLINGQKNKFKVNMYASADSKTLRYKIAGDLIPGFPLVIDPVMVWSTYVHNNTSSFDEYLYTIAVNTSSEVYACGLTNEAMSTAYMSGVAPGFSGTYNYGLSSSNSQQSVILYRLNPTGTAITAWTYTGQTTNVPVAMGIFPDNRVLVVYQQDTIQIFSGDLTTRHYSNVISTGVSNNVLSYQSQAIIDNDVFYLGGVAESALPSSVIPASAPDPVISRNEGVILRITNATTSPVAAWGTFVGGSSHESFTAIAATPDKTKIAFAVHVNGSGSSYPTLVNAVDNTIAGTELLVGVIAVGKPTAFLVFSYLGGSSDEGKSSSGSNAALVAADNNYFYVAGNTTSTDLPGTTGAVQSTHGTNSGNFDQFLSQIPLNGSAGSGFITTYNGADEDDIVGGLVIDYRTNDVLLFGTTESTNFPVFNAVSYSPFYQPVHGNTINGAKDITYTVFANGLASRKFSTYIGGSYNDYLGSTGKLVGTGHFQYCPTNGLTYIGTTIHSDQTTLPTQWMTDIPGFDKSVTTASTSKDNHFIFAMSPNTSDYGDAPASYDAGVPANSAVDFAKIRIGYEIDAENVANSSPTAFGDDNQNYGSFDDEDGVSYIPTFAIGDITYSVTVSVFNNTGATVNMCGWIDANGNGIFDASEYTTVNVLSGSGQQLIVLNFTNLPPFVSTSGFTFLRIRLADVTLTAADATGDFGRGEVEDYMMLKSSILSVVLQNFLATPSNDQVQLNWTINAETALGKYEIEHSADGIQFTTIGSTAATGIHDYNWLHTTPLTGDNYYRLKIIAIDGSFAYSNIRLVNFTASIPVTVYPIPATDVVHLNVAGNILNKPASLYLYSFDGRVLFRKNISSLANKESLDVSHFPNGQYILKITAGNKVVVKKVEINRH
ncbi:hypothetical protein BH11BAC3_BH11BAC3_40000 [soil metagenome]